MTQSYGLWTKWLYFSRNFLSWTSRDVTAWPLANILIASMAEAEVDHHCSKRRSLSPCLTVSAVRVFFSVFESLRLSSYLTIFKTRCSSVSGVRITHNNHDIVERPVSIVVITKARTLLLIVRPSLFLLLWHSGLQEAVGLPNPRGSRTKVWRACNTTEQCSKVWRGLRKVREGHSIYSSPWFRLPCTRQDWPLDIESVRLENSRNWIQ